MQKKELSNLISSPDLLNRESLEEVAACKAQFPYSQALRLLYLKNLFLVGDDWQPVINETAAYVSDRRVLYNLLYPIEVTEYSPTDVEAEEDPLFDFNDQDVFPPFDLIDTGEEPEEESPVSDETKASDLLVLELEDDENREPETSQTTQATKQTLIDQFIAANPRLEPRHDKGPAVDISEESVKEHDSIFTDTLARIYVKQGLYSKAIFAYEKLILKFPEKSDYFADQIEAIRKLTNNQ
jgi:hypothetical protein